MLDVGLAIYAGLLGLAIWRHLCFYWCCGLWLSILNYVALLYIILSAVSVYLIINFYQAAQLPIDVHTYPLLADLWSVSWLHSFILVAPGATVMTMALNWLQTEGHVFEIHKRIAMTKHDRAVQIIALPSVFGVMALASMLPVLELTTGRINSDMMKSPWSEFTNPLLAAPLSLLEGPAFTFSGNATVGKTPAKWEEAQRLALWRYETCFYVADLFEAWGLFQFGRLVLEQVRESLAIPETPSEDNENPQSKMEQDLADSHSAVTALTWVGTSLFVVLCIIQSACSLWPYMGGDPEKQDVIMFHLNIAGVVCSSAAIYNLIVVERAFHRHLTSTSPWFKFLTVKLLVSLAFVQRALITLGKALNSLMPHEMQQVLSYVPFVGDILRFSDLQMHLFYPALVIYECLFLAFLHLFVWRANEVWYQDTGSEREPLVSGGSKSSSS